DWSSDVCSSDLARLRRALADRAVAARAAQRPLHFPPRRRHRRRRQGPSMKVTHVRTTPLAVPFLDAHVTWMGAFSTKSTLLIEVFTDEGLVGLGEAPGVPFPDVIQIVVHEFEHLLRGMDPVDVVEFNRRCLGSQSWHRFRSLANYALGGLDMALWDLTGKKLGQPLHRL